MKRIYLIDEHVSSRTNGIGPFMKAYVACLKRMKVSISIVSFNEDIYEFAIQEKNGIRKLLFPIFPTGNFPRHYRIVNRFFRLYIEDSVDNVFCFNHSPCKELLQTVKESFPLSKLVFTIHDMAWTGALKGESALLKQIAEQRRKKRMVDKYGNLLECFDNERQMYDTVDAVVCLSHNTYDILKNVYRVSSDKINLIPSGMQASRVKISDEEKMQIRRRRNIAAGEMIILYAGRLSAPKGVYPLVRAFAGILEKNPNTRLVLAGSANNEWTTFLASIKDISSKITLTGFIPKKELVEWLQIADVGVIPSYYEQCPYVGMEMMMYGLPLVVSDANGLKDMFADRVNAKVAPIGNREDGDEFARNIRVSLEELLNSPQLRLNLGEGAKRTFHNTYSLTSMLQRYQEFYRKKLN